MSSIRMVFRAVRPSMAFARPLTTTSRRMASPGNAQGHEGAAERRKVQSEKPSTSKLEGEEGEMGVGEMEGGTFKIEPLRRTGEDANTTRARLLYQSRKRGTLESDLLMSTFAEAHLRDMTPAQLAQFDLFLDENDWDIYYWATQEPSPTSRETAEGAGVGAAGATPNVAGKDKMSPVAQGTDAGKQTGPELETDEWRQGKPRSGEWAQTVGTFKPAYRPVPARWRNSEILAMLRRHVISRSAGGIHEEIAEVSGDGLAQSVKGTGGGGKS